MLLLIFFFDRSNVICINMISSEQEVLLEKIMLEAPGVPCFLLGHSTGGAVVLKVRLVKLNPFSLQYLGQI
jgi:hypothetical protein